MSAIGASCPFRRVGQTIAFPGAFLSIAQDGRLRVERGYVCPEDEVAVVQDEATAETDGDTHAVMFPRQEAAASDVPAESEEEDGLTPITVLTPLTCSDSWVR
ncbi:hypothetical protein V5F46_14880, partial [Xanthobacter autotrophicus]